MKTFNISWKSWKSKINNDSKNTKDDSHLQGTKHIILWKLIWKTTTMQNFKFILFLVFEKKGGSKFTPPPPTSSPRQKWPPLRTPGWIRLIDGVTEAVKHEVKKNKNVNFLGLWWYLWQLHQEHLLLLHWYNMRLLHC